jgi:hypothetical protein
MRNITKFFAIILFLFVVTGVSFGQCDETCNAGDILWVKDTVAADVRFDGGGTGACYNDFDAPFGIEAVATSSGGTGALCDGAIVRVVLGANNYGPASASWSNRTDASNRITFSFSPATANQIVWEGWIDETTQCTAWDVGGCPITLDFDTGTGSGLQLNGGGASSVRFVFEWIRVINAALDGVLAPVSSSFRNFEASDNGGDGIDTTQVSSDVTFSRFTGNAGTGLIDAGGGAQSYIAYNRFFLNGDDGFHCANSTCIFNISYDNVDDGIVINLTNANVLHNVSYSNGGDGILAAGTIDNIHVVGNLLVENGGFGLNISAAGRNEGIIEQNNYRDNVAGTSALGAGTSIRVNIDGIPASGDITDCPFTNPTGDLSLVSGCQFSMVFPPESGVTTTSNLLKGAAQTSGVSVGGGNVAF